MSFQSFLNKGPFGAFSATSALAAPPRTRHRTAEGGCEAPLGNNTIFTAKSKNPFENQLLKMEVDGKQTLVRRDYKGKLHVLDVDGKKTLMFERQNAARLILGKKVRTHFCMRWSCSKVKDGNVAIQTNGQDARYKNLSVCGLGWVCPVCANKISEHRRKEMQTAQEKHDATEGTRYLITWTFPHDSTDRLSDIYDKLGKARMIMTAHRSYKNYSTQCEGSIRTVEITLGKNGWHPHVHEIWFAKTKFDKDTMKASLHKLWTQACLKAGLPAPSFEHGVDIKESQFASDYIAKWGFEMTRWHQKTGHSGGMTPFQLLDAHIDEEDDEKANWYKAKFFEFWQATKGTSQLRWSKGLRKHFGIDEIEDEAIVNDEQEVVTQYEFFMWLTADEWKFIRDFRKGAKRVKSDLRADVLQVARQAVSPNQVLDFLEEKGLTKEKRSAIIEQMSNSARYVPISRRNV
jgi:hypothetical protein